MIWLSWLSLTLTVGVVASTLAIMHCSRFEAQDHLADVWRWSMRRDHDTPHTAPRYCSFEYREGRPEGQYGSIVLLPSTAAVFRLRRGGDGGRRMKGEGRMGRG